MCDPNARQKARAIVKSVGIDFFIKAQKDTCPICCEFLTVQQDINIDHVYSINELKHGQDPNNGNLLIVHRLCNEKKGNRPPSNSEIATLAMVNDILGFNEATGIYTITKHAIHAIRANINTLKAKKANVLRFPLEFNRGAFELGSINAIMYQAQIDALELLIHEYYETLNDDRTA